MDKKHKTPKYCQQVDYSKSDMKLLKWITWVTPFGHIIPNCKKAGPFTTIHQSSKSLNFVLVAPSSPAQQCKVKCV